MDNGRFKEYVRLNQVKTVEIWLEKGQDVEAGEKNETPLSIAVHNGFVEMSWLLIKYHAEIKDFLFVAVKQNSVYMVEMLLDNGASHEQLNLHGQQPLALAVYEGSTDIVKLLITRGADVSHVDINGDTALHNLPHTMESSCFDIARLLVSTREDMRKSDVQNRWGLTPLHNAAKHSIENVILYFIEKGASGILRDLQGHTPLYTALHKFSTSEHGGNMKVIAALVEQKHEGKYGVANSIPDNRGISPLNCLIRQKYKDGPILIEVILLLLEFNADPSAVFPNNYQIKGPLLHAFELRKDDIVLALLRNGANIDVKDPWGGTLLHYHLRRSRNESRETDTTFMEILYLYKVDINATDNMGHTALHYATLFNLPSAVQFLLNVGGHMYAEDIHGMIPSNLTSDQTMLHILERGALNASKRMEMLMMSTNERTHNKLSLLNVEMIHAVIEALYGMPPLKKEQKSKYSGVRLQRIRDKIRIENIRKSHLWLSSRPILNEKAVVDRMDEEEADKLLSIEDNALSSDSDENN